MRRVPLKTLPVKHPLSRQVQDLQYAEVLILLTKRAQSGVGSDDMAMPLAMVETIEAAAEEGRDCVLLEEPEWTWLVGGLNGYVWPFVDRVFNDLVAEIRNAEKVDPNRGLAAVAAE